MAIAETITSTPTSDNHTQKALHTWLDTDGARLVCDAAGRLLWRNEPASTMIGPGKSLFVRNGALYVEEGGHSAPLSALIVAASSDVFRRVLFSRDGQPKLCLRFVSIGEDEHHLRWGVRLRELPVRPRLDDSILRHHFALTICERATLDRLIQGYTAERVSEAMGVSIETVRTHIRRIYTKIGAKSREDLFARLVCHLDLQ